MKERPNKCYDERVSVDRICQHMAYLFTYVYLERKQVRTMAASKQLQI